MRGYRKVFFGLAVALPYLWAAYSLGYAAITLDRDLTATGILIGAIATGIIGVVGAFVYGNIREGREGSAQ